MTLGGRDAGLQGRQGWTERCTAKTQAAEVRVCCDLSQWDTESGLAVTCVSS